MKVMETDNQWTMNSPQAYHGCIVIPKHMGWTFNSDYDDPTFAPSVNETWGKEGQSLADFQADTNPNRNHFFVRDGFIQYLSDCTHELAGQTVEIPPMSDAQIAMERHRKAGSE